RRTDSPPLPYTTLFRSGRGPDRGYSSLLPYGHPRLGCPKGLLRSPQYRYALVVYRPRSATLRFSSAGTRQATNGNRGKIISHKEDRKSTRLNSSHEWIS